jgi:DNA modification methylase
VRWLNLDPTEAHLLALADNKLTEIGEWDDALVGRILAEAQAEGADLTGLGWDESELLALMAGGGESEKGSAGGEDSIPEQAPRAVSRLGETWILGPHRLTCGDSSNKDHIDSLFGKDGRFDLLLTDPPYGVSYKGKTSAQLEIENDDLTEAELSGLMAKVFDIAESKSRPGAYWYATVPAGPLHILFAEDWKRRSILRQIMVWAKDVFVLGHSEYHYQHEPTLFGWVAGPRHKNPDRTRSTLWSFDRPKANREHPTMKPVDLWIKAINDGSLPGEVVFDPFCGSGTTIIACEQIGRKARGMELSPVYADVIVRRWQRFTDKPAVLEGDGRSFDEVSRERLGEGD